MSLNLDGFQLTPEQYLLYDVDIVRLKDLTKQNESTNISDIEVKLEQHYKAFKSVYESLKLYDSYTYTRQPKDISIDNPTCNRSIEEQIKNANILTNEIIQSIDNLKKPEYKSTTEIVKNPTSMFQGTAFGNTEIWNTNKSNIQITYDTDGNYYLKPIPIKGQTQQSASSESKKINDSDMTVNGKGKYLILKKQYDADLKSYEEKKNELLNKYKDSLNDNQCIINNLNVLIKPKQKYVGFELQTMVSNNMKRLESFINDYDAVSKENKSIEDLKNNNNIEIASINKKKSEVDTDILSLKSDYIKTFDNFYNIESIVELLNDMRKYKYQSYERMLDMDKEYVEKHPTYSQIKNALCKYNPGLNDYSLKLCESNVNKDATQTPVFHKLIIEGDDYFDLFKDMIKENMLKKFNKYENIINEITEKYVNIELINEIILASNDNIYKQEDYIHETFEDILDENNSQKAQITLTVKPKITQKKDEDEVPPPDDDEVPPPDDEDSMHYCGGRKKLTRRKNGKKKSNRKHKSHRKKNNKQKSIRKIKIIRYKTMRNITKNI